LEKSGKLGKMKILLIEPPFYRLYKDTFSLPRYPLALGYLSGIVKKETKWDVLSYNADFNPKNEGVSFSYVLDEGFKHYQEGLEDLSRPVWKEIKSTIKQYKPDVIGISSKSQNFASTCVVADLVKEIDRKTIVIIGGPHPSMVGRESLKNPNIDVVVRGEGEVTLVELLNAIEKEKSFDKIKGIVYRKNGKIVENEPREFIEDLDSLPFPHETAPDLLKDFEKYPISAFRNIFAIRGCPFNCFFCGSREIWGRRCRFRSVENVIEEIKGLEKMGLKSVNFDDDTLV
jgi:radical SAM superfamily enzyme YgiQ (UPF0313 family)